MHEQKRVDVKVWDPLIRLLHWSLVASFFSAYFSEEDLLDLHVYAGYLVLGLVIFRVVRGFVGSRHARFSDFVRPPAVVIDYLRDVVTFRARRYLGHNPAGRVMVVVLLVMLFLICVSGLVLYGADESAGPLAAMMAGVGEFWIDALEEVHEFLANFTLLLVLFHVIGVLLATRQHHENLVYSMITGYKRRLE